MTDDDPFDHEPLADLTAFQRDVLRVIEREGSPMGLRVKDVLESQYDIEEVNHGRLYPNLNDLAAMDLLAKSERDKRTNEYELTEAGKEALDEHRAWLEPE